MGSKLSIELRLKKRRGGSVVACTAYQPTSAEPFDARTHFLDMLSWKESGDLFLEYEDAGNKSKVLTPIIEIRRIQEIRADQDRMTMAKTIYYEHLAHNPVILDTMKAQINDIVLNDPTKSKCLVDVLIEMESLLVKEVMAHQFERIIRTGLYARAIQMYNSSHGKISMSEREFEYGEIIGSGAFGYVLKCRKISTANTYAMKIQPKAMLVENHKPKNPFLLMERHAMSVLDSPFIARLYEAFQTHQYLGLVMEYADGVNLKQVLKHNHQRLPIGDVKFYGAEVILALEVMHNAKIAHRDVKLENIMVKDDHVVLVDFGFGIKSGLGGPKLSSSFVGTPAYMPPEIIK